MPVLKLAKFFRGDAKLKRMSKLKRLLARANIARFSSVVAIAVLIVTLFLSAQFSALVDELTVTLPTLGDELAPGQCLKPAYRQKIDEIWKFRHPDLIQRNQQRLGLGDSYILYSNYTWLHNLARMAQLCQDNQLLDQISEVILSTEPFLVERDGYRVWLCTTSACPQYSNYKDKEVFLSSGQFLLLVSGVINSISLVSPPQRTTYMNQLIEKLGSVVVRDHELRWISLKEKPAFMLRKWWCEPNTTTSHYEYLNLLLKRDLPTNPPYCQAYSDRDWNPAAIAANLLGAESRSPGLLNLTEEERETLKLYVQRASRLFANRLERTYLTPPWLFPTPQRNLIRGRILDGKLWNTHSEWFCADISRRDPPPTRSECQAKIPTKNLSWDISHWRRIVDIMYALSENRTFAGTTFPTLATIDELANQVAYGVFNGRLNDPRFTNYTSGQDGWYGTRFDAWGNLTSGYSPMGLAVAVPTSGYYFWSGRSNLIGQLAKKTADLYLATDEESIKKRREVFGLNESRYSLELLMFYPTLSRRAL